MAIQKSKTLPNGAYGNYWKITKIMLDKQTMIANCTLSLFTSQTQTNGASLGFNKVYRIPVTKQQLAGDLISLCYAGIKAQSITKSDEDILGGANV